MASVRINCSYSSDLVVQKRTMQIPYYTGQVTLVKETDWLLIMVHARRPQDECE